MTAVLCVAGLLGVGVSDARAGFTITLATGSPTGSGPYTYSYTASIPDGDQINNGDFFRIYDFYGYVNGSISAPSGWTATTQNSTATPPPNVILSHGDDPSVPNLIFTYSGTAPVVGPASITGFTAQSVFPLPPVGTIKDFVGRDTKSTGPTAGTPVDSIGDVRVPAVPEPTSVLSSGLGIILLGFGYAVRSRRKLLA
jgi:hypothetical protein